MAAYQDLVWTVATYDDASADIQEQTRRALAVIDKNLAETGTERVQLGVNPELGRPEHHEFRWLRHAEARTLLVDRLRAVLDWADGLLLSTSRG